MKILHLLYESEGDLFGIGGVGTRAYEIYDYLKARHDITLLCKKYPGARDGEIRGLRHIFVGTETRSLTRALLSYACAAAKYVREHGDEFDVIVEEFSPAIPTFLPCFTRKPLVLQVQGYTGIAYFRKYNPAYALVLFALERIRPLFYRTLLFVTGLTVRHFPAGKRQIAVISNGIAPELLDTVPGEHGYILSFGRIDVYHKGLDILLQAYAGIHQEFPGIRLVVAGDGRDRGEFSMKIAELAPEIRDSIELTGWISGSTKKEVLRKALFAVFPSRHEVQPIAVLEVMGSSRPLIVSDIAEFSFVMKSGAGMSFKSGDAASLAQSMKRMLACRERREMGEKGRAWVKELTWDRIAHEYESFLLEVAKAKDSIC